ncbi:glutamate receptor 2.8-like protein, partial [Tanacetum coccineum]
AALKAVSCKVAKHEKACIENQHVFIPFAFDTFGFLAPEAVELLTRVQRVMNSNIMTPRSINVVFNRIGFAIQKGLAVQLVARLPSPTIKIRSSGHGAQNLVEVSNLLVSNQTLVMSNNNNNNNNNNRNNNIPNPAGASYLIFSLLPCYLLQATLTTGSNTVVSDGEITRIGVILDQTLRAGKEAKVSIEMAVQDLNIEISYYKVLSLKNSHVHAAINAAKELIDEHKVKAILGGHTWEEVSAIAEVISEADHDIDTPVFLSLASTTPLEATDQWPFFVQAVPTQSTQMNAVAALLQTWGIHQVTLILETSHLASSSAPIISHLSRAFQKTGSVLTHILPLVCSLDEELELLKRQQRQVFLTHTSLELGARLFQTAKKMEMTGDGYLWISSNQITDLFHSVNSTMTSSLEGLVGVKSYFPRGTQDFQDFRKRFRHKFRSDYSGEDQDEPGIFAVQGYNAGRLLENLDNQITLRESNTVEIVNVIGNGYHSVYWTQGLGFLKTVVGDNLTDEDLGKALWPVQPWYAHRRGRNLVESSETRMRVGVPVRSLFTQFVSVDFDSKTNQSVFSGFSVAEQKFDAVVGEVMIASTNYDLADFTQRYTESGLEMIVPVQARLLNQAWLFMEPFTKDMWGLLAAITIYNGFIIWLIERNHYSYYQGSVINQIGVIIWLAFTTTFTLRGDKMHSNLSRMAVVMWLFVALIITQSYTASLTSMLTAHRLEPAITSIETLRNTNATVGYCDGSFIDYYLKDVLGFTDIKIKSYSSPRKYAQALNSGEIAALFLEVPLAKIFLARYCKSFIRTGETFKVGGYGFAFYTGFPRLSDANKALMKANKKLMDVTKTGKIESLIPRPLAGFKSLKIRSYTSTSQYAEELNSGEIAAILLEVLAAKVFLAQYCKTFIRTAETFKLEVLDLSTQKDPINDRATHLRPDPVTRLFLCNVKNFRPCDQYGVLSYAGLANKALMNIPESGKLKELEDTFLNSKKCMDKGTSADENNRLSPHSFWVLFKLTVGTSIVVLTIYSFINIKEHIKSNQEHTNPLKEIPTLIRD